MSSILKFKMAKKFIKKHRSAAALVTASAPSPRVSVGVLVNGVWNQYLVDGLKNAVERTLKEAGPTTSSNNKTPQKLKEEGDDVKSESENEGEDLKPLTKVISLYNKLNHETDTFVVAIRLKFGLDGLEIAWDALDEAYCRAKSASRAAHLKKVREDNQRAGEAGPSTSSNITSLKEAGPSTSSNNKTSHVLKEEGDNHESEDNLEKKDKTDPESESENESDNIISLYNEIDAFRVRIFLHFGLAGLKHAKKALVVAYRRAEHNSKVEQLKKALKDSQQGEDDIGSDDSDYGDGVDDEVDGEGGDEVGGGDENSSDKAKEDDDVGGDKDGEDTELEEGEVVDDDVEVHRQRSPKRPLPSSEDNACSTEPKLPRSQIDPDIGDLIDEQINNPNHLFPEINFLEDEIFEDHFANNFGLADEDADFGDN